MADHPIEGMMDTTLEKIKQMVDVNSIVGDPITSPEGTIIIPISKVNYGFASGGSDIPVKSQPEREFFGGGTGAGVTITPIAFLTVSGKDVKLLRVDPGNSSADRIIELAPELIEKISSLFGKGKKSSQAAPGKETGPDSKKQS